ncbi:pseudoazurin [Tritonibacter mobilis]|uniref:pseudoazurin n=1 Tax=Tritonibacter mobilis TaxID=379347 RepID=UPI001CDA5485|nr:pseudoazurin [Tritonibacter mobilis]MCA2006483.1 pseudoazurin [Tritonibacter mobilis]
MKFHMVFAAAMMASPLIAETHEVQMFNRNEQSAMLYQPEYLQIAPGDSVRFIPTQPSHNAATIDGMIPEGATPFKSKINEDFTVTLTESGRYGIKCSPHFAMGMVMVIDVGDVDVAQELPEDLPKRAMQRFRDILAVDAQ